VRNGKPMILRPQQLVLATGMSGVPNMPSVPGMETFKGDLHHSNKHPGPDGYKGKKAVVIGANNSGHDICAALWEEGADVTSHDGRHQRPWGSRFFPAGRSLRRLPPGQLLGNR
jgi:putative flavoprotein involved in K+ transport